MKNFALLLFWLTSLVTAKTVSAEIVLNIAEAFNIKAVNGSSYSSGFIKQNKSLKLRNGLNLIALEYEEVFENENNDTFDIVKSDLYLLKVYLQNNQEYQQRFVKPHDAKAAKSYIKNPIFEIIGLENKTPIRFELEPLESNQTSFVIAKTKLGGKTTINLSSVDKTPQNKFNPSQTTQKNDIQPPQSNASKMLDYWWLQATPEERKMFLDSHSINQ